MTEADRRTKAQILDELAKSQAKVEQYENRPVAKIERVASADALAGCIRALEPLAPPNSSYGSRSTEPKDIASVLRHLADRYGVDLTVRITEPCQRDHIDDASDDRLIHALRHPRVPLGDPFR